MSTEDTPYKALEKGAFALHFSGSCDKMSLNILGSMLSGMRKSGSVVGRSRSARHEVDMTVGSEFGHLWKFALPLLMGNLFQQLYNMVDTWVVGNYVSDEAFSAVGTVGPIINMLIGTFMGFASGAGVVISQYFGAKNEQKVREAVHSAIALTCIFTVFFTVLGLGMTNAMLKLMKTPAEVFPESKAYLTIYFAGLVGLLFYNMGSAILRAVGDSRRPFYFLVVSAVLNTVLDLVFVLVFHMGVEGVAYATIIAQGVSAICTMVVLLRTDSWIRVRVREIRLHGAILKKIIRVGIPAALQMAVTAFSNVFVQSYINQFGKDVMGGWTAYAKVDQLVFLPMQSIALATTTFVGQNLGVGDEKRARHGVRTALLMAMGITVVVAAAVMLAARPLVAFFNDTPAVVESGSMFLVWLSPFYVLCVFNQVYSAALRGAGNSRAPMIIMLTSFVGFRQLYLWVMSTFIVNEILPLSMSYPAGWLVCSILLIVYYHSVGLKRSSLVSESEIRPAGEQG